MFLEIANNNGTKYIRICETVRVPDQKTGKSKPVKKTIKNIGPVTRFDDGKPDFISRLKSSFTAGQPILDELKPYVSGKMPQEVYNIRLVEGTDDCIAHPRLVANLLLEKILEELDMSQFVRTYKAHYNIHFDVYGFMKLLLFGRILNPASKWATVKQSGDYAFPVVKGDVQDYNVYDALDFIYEHRSAIFNRINTNMVNKYGRTTKKVFYDVTNFFFETDEPDEDLSLPDGSVEKGLRQKGVSKENRKSPIVQMGLLMDEQGIPVSIECFPGNTLDMLTLSKAFSNSVSSISNGKERYVYVCDKGIGKGEAIQYAVSRGMGYITSRTVRGSSADEKKWILDQEGYKVVNENFRYKTRIVKKKTTAPDGTVLEYAEKVLTYWKRKYYEKEVAENQQFFEFVQEYLKNPSSFRLKSTQVPLIKKYLNKSVVNKKTGEIIAASDLSALLDVNKLRQDCELFGYYTIATSEINMDDMEILNTYSNLVEIEEQFHIMKSTLDTRPIFVRTKEHIIAHLTVCTIALILIRLIQRQVNLSHPDLLDPGLLFSNILSADRIQSALNKWKVEKLGDVYYRFCDSDNADLALILNSFGISIPTKCFRTQEIKQLKTAMQMST